MSTSSSSAGSPNLDSKAMAAQLLAVMAQEQDTPPPQFSAPNQNPDTGSDPDSGAPQRNIAIDHCCDAYNNAIKLAIEKKLSSYDGERRAEKAYRQAMPPLSGEANIRDFITCLGHAMLLNVISPEQGTKFLYAAQIAFSACDRQKRSGSPFRSKDLDPRIAAEINPKSQTAAKNESAT
jgi:hypothetical protein